MNWEDDCYLLSKRKFRENANIINIFTEQKGKMSGIVYGGTSRKIKNFLQISNKLFAAYSSKNENRLGYFKTELNAALVADEQFTTWLEARTPAGRWGDVSELVGTAVYLAAPASSFVNGQIIYVDGGLTATV